MSWNITDSKLLENAIFDLKMKLARKIGVKPGMTVVDVGCGQGGFTASLAKSVGGKGKVLAVDVSDEYLGEFAERLSRYGVSNVVTFVQADAADLRSKLPTQSVDMVVSYRLLEELKQCEDMPAAIRAMAQVVKSGGGVSLVEMSTEAKNEAELNYIHLHMDSGDCFFERRKILDAMKVAGLRDVHVEMLKMNIWFSPDLARQDLGFAQVWCDAKAERALGPSIDKYGMKYPAFLIFKGERG